MIASWLSQIMLPFYLSYWNPTVLMLYCYLLETTIMPVTISSTGGFAKVWGKCSVVHERNYPAESGV